MVRYLADFAAKTGVKVSYGTRVTRVSKHDDVFTVEAGDRRWRPAR